MLLTILRRVFFTGVWKIKVKLFRPRTMIFLTIPLGGANFEIITMNNSLSSHNQWAGSLHFPPRAGCFFHGRQVRPERQSRCGLFLSCFFWPNFWPNFFFSCFFLPSFFPGFFPQNFPYFGFECPSHYPCDWVFIL